ncbi:S-layer homology domain-containing protein [Paenibacillus sp. MMS18-CY102]|uniref:S-layer homology domain-containing protein n=1 Tax=Paenibacillus sp. MMS18-CY102 TaxID=2682849 RepID=UPI00136525FD|nr:S-layer homology domain-containing protein [Paenibacillus sp. MMS18-CY102]MWC27397.1 S-layer homology domain-containing protein [Paenibacillus sp. MMS18-CY102]
MKRMALLTLLLLAGLLAFGQSVFAFSDTKGDPNEGKIDSLQEQGIIAGHGGKYRPGSTLTYAEGVAMLVKGFGLNIDNIRFVKEPKASDHFPNVKDDKWYSSAFIIAEYTGLDIPQDVKPSAPMTREQFAHHLFKAMTHGHDFAFIDIYNMIKDEKDINPAYMDSIQKLLITHIVSLDSSQKFYPTKQIKRGDAAAWLHDGIAFVKDQSQPTTGGGNVPAFFYDAKLSIAPVTKAVNEVTITADVPNPGYGVRVQSITFEGDQAIISIISIPPDPDRVYPQVITTVTVKTYVSSDYRPTLQVAGGNDPAASSSGSVGSSAKAS